ncbi:MAG: sigma-54-dependent Fis family transcriptional regulator [Bacteroidetes bacterium]|nr:sigma-54-dependent Fis family transcriptional regulator [Bacteroidota bacterium]
MAVPTILVVDDEASIRRTLREILEYEDYGVDEAEDGEVALERLKSNRYDVVLLDIKMPRKDGIDVLQVISEQQWDIPVVMISGHGTIETAVEATKLGAFDFIEKPPDLNRLLLTIRNALDRGQPGGVTGLEREMHLAISGLWRFGQFERDFRRRAVVSVERLGNVARPRQDPGVIVRKTHRLLFGRCL